MSVSLYCFTAGRKWWKEVSVEGLGEKGGGCPLLMLKYLKLSFSFLFSLFIILNLCSWKYQPGPDGSLKSLTNMSLFSPHWSPSAMHPPLFLLPAPAPGPHCPLSVSMGHVYMCSRSLVDYFPPTTLPRLFLFFNYMDRFVVFTITVRMQSNSAIMRSSLSTLIIAKPMFLLQPPPLSFLISGNQYIFFLHS